MYRALLTGVLTVSTTLAAALPAHGQTGSTGRVLSDQILPQDTYLYVSFPNITALKSHFTQASVGQLWNDPALDDFKAEVTNAFSNELDEGLVQVQEALGLTLLEFLQIPSGEISMAVSKVSGNKMGLVIFMDFGDKEQQVQDLLAKAVEVLSQIPKLSHEDEVFDGTALTMFQIQYPGKPPTPLAKEFGWFVKDGRLVISNRGELLESALTNWGGEANDAFTSNEAYSYIMSRCQSGDRTSLSTFFLDPIGLVKDLITTGSLGQQATMGGGMLLSILPMTGLNQLKAMGTIAEAGSGEFESVQRSVFYSEQPPIALMQVFQLDEGDQAPPAWVKEDATTYIALKWKIDDAFNAIESLVDSFQGSGAVAERLNQLAKSGPGLHVKKDIIDQLTGQIRLVGAPGGRAGYGGDQMLLALGVRNDESAAAVLSKIADLLGMQSREFQGATLYEIEGPEAGQSVGVVVSGGQIMIGLGESLMNQTLRNDDDIRPLSESADYRRVAQHFPANALSIQFSRPAEQYRSLYEMLQSGEAADQFPGMDELFDKVDFTTLPPFEAIAKYIHPAGSYAKKDENGMFVEAFQLSE
ncbi:MAG TPA: hypothetical protein EYG03_04295 [Planctomycetes bacterium]|nr:hypothetical protein [Fuerstiella sp.]HIK91199.1 hypothetical protein [Planctomycetota bacterium]